MSDVSFLILASAAAIAFAIALFGVMTQWLKADEQANALEGAVQRRLSSDPRTRDVVMATSAHLPGVSAGRGESSTAGAATRAKDAAVASEAAAAEVSELDRVEMHIARHLMAWGGPSIVLGLGLGWYLASFAGSLIGATIGTVVGVAVGAAVAALQRQR
jgi:F0F1-type ATP synthase assembly protein I